MAHMCVDYISLNKVCPKHCFPLLKINQLVDSSSGYDCLTFMESCSSFHQIAIWQQHSEHTAFNTLQGCSVIRPRHSGWKKANVAYQRLVNKIFQGHICRNVH